MRNILFFSFKKFKATAHHVNFNRISVFTTDNLEVHLVSVQKTSFYLSYQTVKPISRQ